MKEELTIVLREYRLGLELSAALQRMYDRIPCEDLQLLIISIRLTTQSGGSMADVLAKITQMIRGRTEFQQKLQALTAQGRFEALAMALAPLLAFLLLFARARTGWKPRLLCALVTALMALPLSGLYTSADIYNNKTRNEDLISPWSATQVYTSKGFLYPFLYSVRSASDPAPEGYDAKACEEIMAGYTDGDIPEEQKVDIFTIQLEAYNDFTKFGTPELNPEVYETFHKLESEGYTPEEIEEEVQMVTDMMTKNGYSQQEIDEYVQQLRDRYAQ